MAFDASRNGLIMSGFVNRSLTIEISIPALGGTATVLQSLTDALEGQQGEINPGGTNQQWMGGYYVDGNTLVVSAVDSYDGDQSSVASHFRRPLNLATRGQVVGAYNVGTLNPAYYAGYMGTIPTTWQGALRGRALTGQCCLSIINRTSLGPALFAFDPSSTSRTAVPLVYYTSANPTLGALERGIVHPVFNGTTEVTGVVMPEGTSSVLLFGRTGMGTTCYGEGSACGDPVDSNKGDHAYPYASYVWAYDANELAAVAAGQRQPWSVTPYAQWELLPRSGRSQILGAAYDSSSNKIYVAHAYADGTRPMIHVFTVTVGGGGVTTAPSAPSNVRLIGG
jgi:hypothetical protein